MDLTTLQVIWWLLIGVLLIGFALTDGFDMGVGILLPFVGRRDGERRVVVNTVGATWEGNQVWFITAGGATFAAWPVVYATAFSGFYVALLLVLFSLFFRPVGFDYRNKLNDRRWRSFWDWGIFAGSFVPALVFGVAFGNLLQGVPFAIDIDHRASYHGTFWQLLNPFALLAGVLSVTMLVAHGGAFLAVKAEGKVAERGRRVQIVASLLTAVLFVAAGVWVALALPGLRMTASGAPERGVGYWMTNYGLNAWAWAAPAVGTAGALLAACAAWGRRERSAFVACGLSITGIIFTAGVSMFPFIMPSSLDLAHSLTIWNATSSQRTLQIMLFAVIVFLPLILIYTTWVYRVMRGRVSEQHIEQNSASMY
ncbi:cytochrome d ubiquinol oxidase subunit II [Chitinasiproducens palmae]|uniref:cytochrome d ubiquinol oxidase subunit II n=1 Tax=Chitinasiproducens palmae TaxID=1770053 RepID=UPI000B872427|nr:cytochrome d ubiquinol oxidase subunit II [Chitinasiproducens palmae]